MGYSGQTYALGAPWERWDAFPIDSTSLFQSFDEAQAYASNDEGTSYIGQILSVVEMGESGLTVDVYKIDENRKLTKLGTGDGEGYITEDIIVNGDVVAYSGTSITDAIKLSVEYSIDHGGLIKSIQGDDNISVVVEDAVAYISLERINNIEKDLNI